VTSPRVEIVYCRQCKFLLRAAWFAQELLSAFEGDVAELAIVPGSGGIFEVKLDGEVIATNRETHSMPEIGEVKRLIRDRVAPGRRIGHEDAGGGM